MQSYQLRVIDEKKELDSKLQKLHTFLGSPLPIEKEEFVRLCRQANIMFQYSQILEERIEAFE